MYIRHCTIEDEVDNGGEELAFAVDVALPVSAKNKESKVTRMCRLSLRKG